MTRATFSRRDDRGATVLEAVIVAPLFFALVLGIIEGGFALHGRLSVENMALAGARTASGEGAEVLSDYYVLRSVDSGRGGVSAGDITSIVVYRATAPADRVPAGCRVASVAGSCNRYVGSDLAKDTTQFGCVGPPGPTTKIDSPWCPTARKTAVTGPNGPPDYIGVYIAAIHRYLTGAWGSGITFTADTVMRIEPRTLT